MKRVEDVLGAGWEMYADGQKLQAESINFRKKLDTRPIFDNWLSEISRRNIQITGPIFAIERNRVLGNVFELNVNFDSQAITLFKEVRNLMWLQYQVPHSVISVAKDAKRVYPFAVSLMESVRTYQQTLQKIKENQSDIGPLIAVYVNQVHEHISKGKLFSCAESLSMER
jgi:dynein heavy chain 1